MVRIKAFVTLWRRPNVTRISFEGLKRLQRYKPDEYKITVQCVGSEPRVFAPMCEEYGFDYLNHPNRPLGGKCNAGLSEALKDDWDFLMIVNSDDLISNSLLDYYQDYYDSHYMVGVGGCFFYHVPTGNMMWFGGYEGYQMSMGPGRIIHRDLIEECGGKLWKHGINKNLNASCLRRVNAYGYDETIVYPEDVAILDIKSGTNLHDFDKFQGERVAKEDVFSYFGDKEIEMIREL